MSRVPSSISIARSQGKVAQPNLAAEELLLERFTAEVEAASAVTAALLTHRSARYRGYPVKHARQLETIVPFVPLSMAAAAEANFAASFPASMRARIRELPLLLDDAKTAMETVLGSSEVAAFEKLDRAVEAATFPLQAAATILTGLLDELVVLPHLASRSATTLSLRRLRAAVTAAAGGATPLLVDGNISLPDTSIVIRGMRRSVDLEAKLSTYGQFWKARVVNISQGGYCVTGAKGLESGAKVQLKLDSGRILPGSVKWVDGDRAGIAFASRLLISDPLLNR